MKNLIELKDNNYTSRDIAKWTNKEHKNVLRDIIVINEQYKQAGFIEATFEPSDYMSERGKKYPQYILTRKQCIILASGYNVVLRTMIIDKLEEVTKPKSRLELAKENVFLLEELEHKNSILIEQAPKVDAYETISNSNKISTVSQVAALYGMGRNSLYSWLKEKGFVMKNLKPYQKWIDSGHFDYKIDTKNNKQYYVTLITGKGITELNDILK